MKEIITTIGSETLVSLTTVLINVVIAAFGIYVYPVVKKMIKDKATELEERVGTETMMKLQVLAEQAIVFVENEFKKKGIVQAGEEKKRQVIDYLNKKGFKDIDDETINMIIENAVNEMNKYKKFGEK